MDTFNSYRSPFSWRYGSSQMRKVFSEKNKYLLWRKIWVALAKEQHKAGLLSKKEFADLKKNQDKVSIKRIFAIEKETKHDVVAAIKEFAEKAKIGGGKIHLGATSYDIVDNASTLQAREALELIESELQTILSLFSKKIKKYADMSCIGYTHLQPAEPTTVGYRLAFYAQDFLIDLDYLHFVKNHMMAKGTKGAVGTSASYQSILGNKISPAEFEKKVMNGLGLTPLLISSQISTKKVDYLICTLLASLASSAAKFSNDLRILQSAAIGEWSEPFSKSQVGSSAMPFKRNPVTSEKIVSLARYVMTLPQVVLENATHSYLERTLDDSANRRIVIPEIFLSVDEILSSLLKNVDGLIINEKRIAQNLSSYAPYAATEKIIIEFVKKGYDRQKAHELMRQISLLSWKEIQKGKPNSMRQLLIENKKVNKYLNKKELERCFEVDHHTGDAKERALKLAKVIDKKIHEK